MSGFAAFDLGGIDLPDHTTDDQYPPVVPNRIANIDADFAAYQIAADTRDELDGLRPMRSLEKKKEQVGSLLLHQARMAGAATYIAHITPPGTTKGGRADQALIKPYQGNRKDKEPPAHLDAIRAYIGEELPSAVHLDQEADDGLTQANYADLENSVLISRDKDLRMAPGLHWCFDEETVIEVEDPFGFIWMDASKRTKSLKGWGTKFFWAQMLMGDSADNIAGLPKYTRVDGKSMSCGPVAAYELLEDCQTDYQCMRVVMYLYATSEYEWRDYRDESPITWPVAFMSNARLLWMRRDNNPDDAFVWMQEISK